MLIAAGKRVETSAATERKRQFNVLTAGLFTIDGNNPNLSFLINHESNGIATLVISLSVCSSYDLLPAFILIILHLLYAVSTLLFLQPKFYFDSFLAVCSRPVLHVF